MLVLFRFKNFASFKDEAVFDMRAIKAYKEHPYNLISSPNDCSLLKVVSIYGANASGKSNFINAYQYFSSIVRTSFQPKDEQEDTDTSLESNYFPFELSNETENGNTEFEGVYHQNGNEYRYGFIYNRNRIEYEWLYRKNLSNKHQSTIFERSVNGIEFGTSVKSSCEKYKEDIDENVLALSFFSSLKLKTPVFKETLNCITDILPFYSNDEQTDFMIKRYFGVDFSEDERPKLLAFLNAIDIGIKDIIVEKNPTNKKFAIFTIHYSRDNKQHLFPIEIESRGTIKAISLYSFIRIAALTGRGLMIDEFNNELHPLLQKYLIDLFYEENSGGQLIYTTHDTMLLDTKYMRRDQIWFTEKNENGESSLFSLADFKIRNDRSFEKDYLGGVYGAIPILKDFSFKEDQNGN